MAELLVCARNLAQDRGYVDKELDSKCYERGDIIVVMPDGWQWGSGETGDSRFRILKIPGVTVAQVQAHMGSETDIDPQNPSKFLRRRAKALDLDSATIPQAVRNWLKEGGKVGADGVRSLTVTPAQLLSFVTSKTRIT